MSVTISRKHYADGYETITVYDGLSTDTKPTDCGNGSVYREMDTSKTYKYDAASSAWVEWTGGSGSGGGDLDDWSTDGL